MGWAALPVPLPWSIYYSILFNRISFKIISILWPKFSTGLFSKKSAQFLLVGHFVIQVFLHGMESLRTKKPLRLSTFRMDPSLQSISQENWPQKAASPSPNAAQRAKGNGEALIAKPERGGKKNDRNTEALFLNNLFEKGWRLNRRTLCNLNLISRPDWVFFWLVGVCCCWGFSIGFILWLLFLAVFNL